MADLQNTLIFDRTAADVTAKNIKGTYDYTDLNRVTAAAKQLKTTLNTLGYIVPYEPPIIAHLDGTTSDEWQETDEDIRKSKIESYLTEVLKIKDVLPITIPPDLPTTMNRLTYQGAKNNKKMLYEVYNLIELMTSFYYYSGEIYAGEV